MRDNNLINILDQRSSSILLPVSSLPGPWGIGDIGPTAYQFVDFLKKSGQSSWQILPLGPTSPIFGNSPYMSFSAFAGSPLLISPDLLRDQGLLSGNEGEDFRFSEYTVDYKGAEQLKQQILTTAWQRFLANNNQGRLDEFSKQHPWLDDHCFFLALKKQFSDLPWFHWPMEYRKRNPETLEKAAASLAREIDYYKFEQYLFFSQWEKLRSYAHKNGIQIIGDLPIYVALDSVDVWSHQDIFQLDAKTCEPTHVAGVPPDYFSDTGQLWGNPLYRWQSRNKNIKSKLWDWWEQRLTMNFLMTDLLRIDHFRGFESYWAVPATEKTAINGKWVKGPGKPFFKEMHKRLPNMNIIAEDLGVITPAVERLRDDLGYPGMKILLFAFGDDSSNSYLPHNCIPNSVMYTGTHDNDTAVGWYLSSEVMPEEKSRARRFANNLHDTEAGLFHRDLIHMALSSTANLTVLPLQDVLGFGNDCRMNTPGTTENNWQWRCAPRFITNELADWLYDQTSFFGRAHQTTTKETSIKKSDNEHTDL